MKKTFITILSILLLPMSLSAHNGENHSSENEEMKIEMEQPSIKSHSKVMQTMEGMTHHKKMSDSTKSYVNINHEMHMGMDIEFTGDADIDFLMGMIPHHQGAIDMAKTQLEYGQDGILKSFTQKVIRDQEREIFFMNGILNSLKDDASRNNHSTIAFKKTNKKMHKDMSIEFNGNADIDFVKGMIPHHQGAVEMAKVVLQYGKDTNTRKMAANIINAQESEITWLKKWIRRVNLIRRMR